MSDSTSTAAVIRDPLMLRSIRSLLGTKARNQVTTLTTLNLVIGAMDGFAMLVLLPLSTSLTTHQREWGLTTSGWLLTLAAFALVGAVLRYAAAMNGYGVALGIIRAGHVAIGDALASLPLGWFRSSRTGSLSRLVSDGFISIGEMVAHLVSQVQMLSATLIVIVVGSWVWNPTLGLTLTLIAPIAVVVMVIAQSIRRSASESVVPSTVELSQRIVEFSACQPALRAAGRAEDFEPLVAAGRENDRARGRELWISIIPQVLNGIVMQAMAVTVILITAGLATRGALGPLEAIALIGLTLRYAHLLNDLGGLFISMDLARSPMDEIMAILEAPKLPEPCTKAPLPSPGRVELDGVTFGYAADRPVVKDVTFSAEPGMMLALVGPSGSGKTTIARLIARFWDVDAGAVRVGGTDVRKQSTEQLMAQLSMVFQDVYLFDDTLMENIRIGRENASDEEVHAVADLAGVTSIAERLPDGWQTRVGEGGRSLSGGERQRVSVARALLKQAPIVLLDEATSALDAENEDNIVASVAALREHATVLVIAHKLDTVRAADQILVLDEDGRVAERGTHDELFCADGAYRRFWERREAARGWQIAS
ncbi:ABC transporter ATP-binding protein [Gephyromycinifex aptenodytis]|uniref:ABC transporter ATP-binding protein n=1 Tax=Gephyromycinifex aptenodytis TaxID=2716227 RepID=UPI0014453DDD|nr:ABC transporter ATP-binding protein [Gephyromycinifex aptenodytis]